MASISRNQFNVTKRVVSKILQKGVYLMDADWNEQMDALNYFGRDILSSLLNHTNYRIGTGFKIVGTGASLELTIKAGRGMFIFDDDQMVILHLATDFTLTGFSTFPSERTDCIYLDIEEDEIDASEDPDIVNPEVGEETCVDKRMKYTVSISEGSAPSSPPTGHSYVTLGTVTSDNDVLSDSEVTNSILDYHTIVYSEDGGVNILRNGGFEFFYDSVSNDKCKHWAYPNDTFMDMYLQQDSSYVLTGSYNAKGTGGYTNGGGGVEQIITDFKKYRGRKLYGFIYVACDGDGPETFKLTIDDGITSSNSGFVAIDQTAGTYTKIEVTHTVASNATKLEFQGRTGLHSAVYDVYLGAAGLYSGSNNAQEYEDNPLDIVDEGQDTQDDRVDDIEVVLYTVVSESFTVDIAATALTDSTLEHAVDGGSGINEVTVIRIPYYHRSKYKTLTLDFEGYCESGSVSGNAIIKAGPTLNQGKAFAGTTPTAYQVELNISTLTDESYYEVAVNLETTGADLDSYIRKVMITLRQS